MAVKWSLSDVSLIVITLNEEDNIGACPGSVASVFSNMFILWNCICQIRNNQPNVFLLSRESTFTDRNNRKKAVIKGKFIPRNSSERAENG